MSYARFGEGDVYVYTSSAGIECCMCALVKRHWVDDPASPFGGWLRADTAGEQDPVYRSNAEMVAHLERHRAVGHHVPQDAIDRLNDPEDEAENRAVWAEADAKEATA